MSCINTDDLQPRSLFARKTGNTCNSTRDLPGNTHNFEKQKETHPTSKWNQMTFNQKYLYMSHLMYWHNFFQIFFFGHKKNQPKLTPPRFKENPRWPQLLRSKGPYRAPQQEKRRRQGAKKTKSWKEKGEYILYLCCFLVGGFNSFEKYSIPGSPTTIFQRLVSEPPLFLVGVYHLPKGTTIFKMVVDFQGYSQIGSFPQIGAKIKKMLQTTN